MGLFLNSIAPYDKYKTISRDPYFLDKSILLEELMPAVGREQRFYCITRPRRFGKTVMANMIASFFGTAKDSHDIFDQLDIADSSQYSAHLNQYELIYMDCSEIPKGCRGYQSYISRMEEGICRDLLTAYPKLESHQNLAVWDLLSLLFEKKNKNSFLS